MYMKNLIFLIFFNFIIITPLYSMNEYKLGDKIKLKLNNVSQDKIMEKFSKNEKDYSLERITKDPSNPNATILEFRSFKLGENSIKLTDLPEEEIKFNIISNLEEKEKELHKNSEIFLDYSDNSIKNGIKNIPYLLILGIIIFFIGIYLLLKKEKTIINLTPYEKYYNGINNLSSDYLYEISFLLREYLDSQLSTKFLKGHYERVKINDTELITKTDINFIKELDYSKFSKNRLISKEQGIKKSETIVKTVYNYLLEEEKRLKEEKK